MKYRVLIEQDEDGYFVTEVPSLPGCISQGETRAEALDNIKEAITGYLESLKAHGDPVPPPIEEVFVEVARERIAARFRSRSYQSFGENRLRL